MSSIEPSVQRTSAAGGSRLSKKRRRGANAIPPLRYSIQSESLNQQNDTYRNPVLSADYPDPDVIRDGADFYMVVSSFHCTPGLPILHSKDLLNWRIINHAVEQLPYPRFDAVQPGCGIWAPAIRKHAGKFWIFFGMPDEGIFCTNAEHPGGNWSAPHLIQEGKGLIDPCPLWDDDGNAYLVHAYARSRAGIKHKLRVRPMAPDCSRLLGDGHIVFDDPQNHPTLEGPKFLKRDGYYYILAPAGGVESGWQLALRSRHIYGPYEEKIVLEQGSTSINGPHQGALIDTPAGDWWFMHFQHTKPVGRIVHLQPARWKNDWPLMGIDQDGNGIGEPVLHHPVPFAGSINRTDPSHAPDSVNSDDFNSAELGRFWQWNANYRQSWYSLTARPGWLRLHAQPAQVLPSQLDLIHTPSVLFQKFPASSFVVETRVELSSAPGQWAGLAIIGREYAALVVKTDCASEDLEVQCLVNGVVAELKRIPRRSVVLRIHVANGICAFSFNVDGSAEHTFPVQFQAVEGFWVGAKVGLFAIQPGVPLASRANLPVVESYADFDYLTFHRNALENAIV